MKKLLAATLLLVTLQPARAQDTTYARHIVDTLTSPTFWGRGYTNNGMSKAAAFIASQFSLLGVKPMAGNDYFQKFSYPVNTFPGKMEVNMNGRQLVPGKDFIVSPESMNVKASGKLIQQDSATFVDAEHRVIISIKDKLTWSVAPVQQDYTAIDIDKGSLNGRPSKVKVNIEAKLEQSFKAANVCGIIKGTQKPDSVIVFTAHYDHLGGMGSDTYFPGANDNASGLSLLLSLAKYYGANPQPYSIAFICFAGEEAGLRGSKYFTENPLLPVHQIRFLTNVDLVGTGQEGITVVNATEFPREFTLLNTINDQHQYLTSIKARGKAANSDHYWFSEKGVPAFFMYTMGGIKAYHDVFDRGETLPLTELSDLFKLVVAFNRKMME
jgi:aminopeptidase YwaD